jgi:probable F420-dependent oxidoreductase
MTSDRLPLGPVGVWTGALDFAPASQARELAAELESLGYDAIWLPEVAGRDPMVHLTMLLSATTRLVGATGIANIFARDAITMTGGVKALTEAYPERVLIGLGSSHRHLVQDLRGHPYERPLSAMRDYLDAMDRSPYSAFRPATPTRLVLAALGPRMLELAAERTEGAHTYFVTPEHTERARAALGDGLLCVEQAVLIETDPHLARDIARSHTSVYASLPNYLANLLSLGFTEEDCADGGSDRLVDSVVAWGDEDAVLRRVGAHFDAGADHVCIQPLVPGRRDVPVGAWRSLAAPLAELANGVSRTRPA